jgi:hypothetical protein
MRYLFEIRKILKCSLDHAWKVYVLMDVNFSECSDDEFKQAVYRAAREVL